MIDIEKNIAAVKQKIEQALGKNSADCGDNHGKAPAVTLMAVSKKQTVHAVERAANSGVQHFGENYVQEAVAKINDLQRKDLIWHFIGPIQSNKTADIAEHFSWVHSIDRLKIAQRLNNQRPTALGPLNVCIQINIDDEISKSGISSEELLPLLDAVVAMPNLRIRGLMAIPSRQSSPDKTKASFARMRELFNACQAHLANKGITGFDTLSMGMSQDMTLAILQGATMVRVGTAIFGQREG